MMNLDEWMARARTQSIVVDEGGRQYRVVGVFTQPAVCLLPFDGDERQITLGIDGLTARAMKDAA